LELSKIGMEGRQKTVAKVQAQNDENGLVRTVTRETMSAHIGEELKVEPRICWWEVKGNHED
jgi:hypothetical protein